MPRQADIIAISDDDSATSAHVLGSKLKQKPKRKRQSELLEKVEWTEDSDDGYEALKNRRERRGGKSSGKGKGKEKDGQEKPASGALAGRKKKLRRGQGSNDSDSESHSLFESLPSYIKERRQEFELKRESMQHAGLRLPPDYSDLYFSDDERLEHLDERPQFDQRSGVKPCHEYKDVVLEHSAGVIPASIAQYLRDYQIEGVKFLHYLFVYQIGGILGDDMGLGKTVQVAAFLTAAFGKSGDRRDGKRMRKFRRNKDGWYPRVLIICPGSLTQNWKNELDRWGWWETLLYHGTGKDDVLGAARSGRLEIMITTYQTYKNHRDSINRIAWDVVVADECHSIKEKTSGVTIAMNEVNALCRIGLTGTAIQNKYEELWTLLNWTNPGRFGTMGDWIKKIARPLTIGQSHDATLHQLSEARKTAKKLVENLLPRFFLRRMKSLIAHQLPKKTDKVVFCPLSDLQSEAYRTFLSSPLAEFVRRAYDPCDCGSNRKAGWCHYEFNEKGEKWQALLFPIVMALQKLSSHFSLMIPQVSDMADKQEKELRYLQAAMPTKWREYYNTRDSPLSLANPEFCGKWKVLKKLLKFWHEAGDKVLVFSHSVRLLKILQSLFNNTAYSVSYLDGSLSYEDRQQVVDDFNSDPNQFVFLISTKAGGVGLNITAANKVVIMDPHWNPSYDLQAQDRAYRIGQVRDVDVYRFISLGTIEEITYARQIYKQQQANIGYNATNERRYFKGVQQDSERKGEIFGIKNLLMYHGDQAVLKDIVNKTNIAEARVGVHLADIDMEKATEDADDNPFINKEDGGANDEDSGGLKQLSNMLTRKDNNNNDDKKDGAPSPLSYQAAQKRKTDAVQAILASAGVEYTHENSEVVGTSKIEDELSRQAALAVSQELEDASSRALFLRDDNDNDNDDEDKTNHQTDHRHRSAHQQQQQQQRRPTDKNSIADDLAPASAPSHFIPTTTTTNSPSLIKNYRFNPPQQVQNRQFCTMARTFGFPTAVEFALAVEGMTQEQRRNCLDLFYRKRVEVLKKNSNSGGGGGDGDDGDDSRSKCKDEDEDERSKKRASATPATKSAREEDDDDDDDFMADIPPKKEGDDLKKVKRGKEEDNRVDLMVLDDSDDDGDDVKMTEEDTADVTKNMAKEEMEKRERSALVAVVKSEPKNEDAKPPSSMKKEERETEETVKKEEKNVPSKSENPTLSVWLSDDDDDDEL